mmetsp:Transcript_24654/g.59329  ORF Transcript_24654/g.59329 Transcript_24654/m.59329 type:complete len:410 (-) Transcript_24654:323-1552(-)
MKFGKTLKRHSRPGWRYLNYKFLKQVIRLIHPDSDWADKHFRKTLIEEIEAVNAFFLSRTVKLRELTAEYKFHKRNHNSAYDNLCGKTKELREFMIINYIAVLKIVKKHDKISTKPLRKDILEVLLKQPFYQALKTSALFTQTERFLKEFVDATEKQCTICIESCVTPVRLACGHEFCWECLALAMLSDIKTCPLCRSEQSLNPVDLNITSILGAVDAHKYFPSNVDPVEVRKRAVDKDERGVSGQKRMKCGHDSCEVVDLLSWIEGKNEKSFKKYCCSSEMSLNKSPFYFEREIHIELHDQGKVPVQNAIVLVKAPAESATVKLATPSASKLPADCSADVSEPSDRGCCATRTCSEEVNNAKAMQSKRLNLSPEPSSVEDWINDVMVNEEIDLQNISRSFATVGVIKV